MLKKLCHREKVKLKLLNFNLNSKIISSLIIFCCVSIIYPQNSFRLTGRIVNKENKEILPFAAVYNVEGYCISNKEGVFELKLKQPVK